MKKNPVQFAVVREDPQIEMELVARFHLERATLIGSGGCTAFCLKAQNPALEITLIDPNEAQIALIKEKIEMLENEPREVLLENFGVRRASRESLIERGNFESLFRQLRLFVQEFIISETEIERAFRENSARTWQEAFQNPYWKVAFELFFSDSILTAMFTKAAIQHAPPNSYPPYFQSVLEKGLRRADASNNYFLHHILLGRYFESADALPFYLQTLPTNLDFEFFCGFAQNYPGFDGRQLAHFSNIFDWCGTDEVGEIARLAAENLETGSVVVFRQLNNQKNFRPLFGPHFRWLETADLLEKDRSLFYEKIEIGEKVS